MTSKLSIAVPISNSAPSVGATGAGGGICEAEALGPETAPPGWLVYRTHDAATPQMNVRVPADLQARLYAAARRRGVSRSILVRSALEHAASSPPDLPGPMPIANASSEPHASLPMGNTPTTGGADTDFVSWIVGQTRLPRPLVLAGIARGRVRVDGRECRDVTGGAWEGHEITFDGRPV